jgi:hypothetical protein
VDISELAQALTTSAELSSGLQTSQQKHTDYPELLLQASVIALERVGTVWAW